MTTSSTQRVIISGSIAYDTIMVFDGQFKDHILPDKVHMLNVAFLVPRMKREFGGTAANIAYNLRAIGGDPMMLAVIGEDGDAYLKRLQSKSINTDAIRRIETEFTAQAFITTDLADNQITAFHPGAMNLAHETHVSHAGKAAWGTVSPNGKLAMMQHAQEFHAAGIPYLLDPGQGLPMFNGQELGQMLEHAAALTVNDYESEMFANTMGISVQALAERVPVMVVTRGAQGVSIYEAGKQTDLPAAPILNAVDPTGCGDAFRAGLLYGLAQGRSWTESAQIGAVLGAIKIEHHGPQNHPLNRDIVQNRLRAAYGTYLH
jgi:adenosine kinase